ncbi:MAG: hypothetical protein IKU15_04610 [Clostridia bacterium]|nr:hypothetical protein [Clostridia bacterium]
MFLNVNEYKHLSCDSDMINTAIEDASKNGKIVVIPRFNERTGLDIWDITKTIVMHNDVTLVINNAHLRLNDNAYCRFFINANCDVPMTPENKQKNITIKGIGDALLDGGKHTGIYEKNGIARKVAQKTEYHPTVNVMMMFKNIENLVIDGIHIKNHRYWGLTNTMVTNSRFTNIRFSSIGNVPNQDGLDFGPGCNNIIAQNITGCVGDNLVAICAMTMTDPPVGEYDPSTFDIHDITVQNVMGYNVNGCALIRLLNHDGYKIYNIRIDNVIETSPWSEDDWGVAPNPDLVIKTDDEGNLIPWKTLVAGEHGYRMEAAIIIGESYWYSNFKARPGDTYGVSISNVMTHARFAVWINNTLQDSSFDNIRLFGNGYMAAYFGEGEVENLSFRNISYDKTTKPLKDDENIYIDWNQTESKGYHNIYFNGTKVKNVRFDNFRPCENMDSIVGGFGSGKLDVNFADGESKEYVITENGIK